MARSLGSLILALALLQCRAKPPAAAPNSTPRVPGATSTPTAQATPSASVSGDFGAARADDRPIPKRIIRLNADGSLVVSLDDEVRGTAASVAELPTLLPRCDRERAAIVIVDPGAVYGQVAAVLD